MAKRSFKKEDSVVAPDETLTANAGDQVDPEVVVEAAVAEPEIPEVIEPEVPEVVAPVAVEKQVYEFGDIVEVCPINGAMFEPFERVAIPEGKHTPVKYTSWIKCQAEANPKRLNIVGTAGKKK